MTQPEPLGPLSVVGRLMDASNATFVAEDESHTRWVYKPVRGEAPLWDFPRHTLGAREVAAFSWSETSGFGVVPATYWFDGPYGEGSVQLWLDEIEPRLVDVVPEDGVPAGWFPIVAGLDASDAPVVLCHADDPQLRRLALFDVLANNADRKGGHVLRHQSGAFGVDHGVCFHTEDKLRTVLWGWRGEDLTDAEAELIARAAQTAGEALSGLAPTEVEAAVRRCEDLLASGRFPEPGDAWPVIPWPPI